MKVTMVSDFFDAKTGNPLAVYARMLPQIEGNNVAVLTSDIAEKPGAMDDSAVKAGISRFRAIQIGKKAFFPGLVPKLLFEKDIGIVHVHVLGFFSTMVCALLKPLQNYKLVVTPDFDVRNPVSRFPRTILDFFFFRIPLKRADLILPFTELEKNELHNRFGIDKAKMHVLPIGIFTEMFEKKPLRDYRKELGLQGKFVVLSACYLYPKKNLEMVLDALKLLPCDIVLVHAGGFSDMEYKKKLDSIIAGSVLNGRVFFLGNKNLEEMVDAYKSADVFAQPGFNESYCIPIIEAMAAGLPVLTTRTGVAVEAIKNSENGFFISNAQELSSGIEKLSKNNAMRKAMSNANVKKAKEFDWKAIIARLQKEYQFF